MDIVWIDSNFSCDTIDHENLVFVSARDVVHNTVVLQIKIGGVQPNDDPVRGELLQHRALVRLMREHWRVVVNLSHVNGDFYAETTVRWSAVVGRHGDEVEMSSGLEIFLHENAAMIAFDAEEV